MRIECGSCGAKYSIADEKVFGKVFKVRCKKCGAMINVDGTSMADESDEATRVFDMNARDAQDEAAAPSGPEWYVVIEEEQAGPFSTEDVSDRIARQLLDADSFAWKEGMEDWERLADIDEFAATFPDLASAPSPFPSEPVAMKEEATRVVSSSEGALGGGGSFAPVESFPSGGYASVEPSDAGAFASSAGAASGEDDIFSSVASEPREEASPAFVGARSESSVLFSLDSLTGVRSKDEKPSSAAVPRTEESGLINLEALIATRSQGAESAAAAPAGAGAPAAAAVPATIAIGASSLPKPADRSRVAIIALLVVLLLAIPLTGFAVWLLLGSSDDGAVADAPPAQIDAEAPVVADEPEVEEPTPPVVAETDADPDTEQVVAVTDDEDEEEGVDSAEDAAEETEAARERTAEAARERSAAPERSPAQAERDDSAARTQPTPTPTREATRTAERETEPTRAPTTTRREEPASDDRVSSVLRAVRGEEEEPAARERSAPTREARPQPSGLPEQLTRDDVAVTVRNYGRQIARCKQSDDHAGVYIGRWVIQPSGSVTNAQVNNMNETGQCILGVIRNFSFPRFTGDPITIPRFNFTIN